MRGDGDQDQFETLWADATEPMKDYVTRMVTLGWEFKQLPDHPIRALLICPTENQDAAISAKQMHLWISVTR